VLNPYAFAIDIAPRLIAIPHLKNSIKRDFLVVPGIGNKVNCHLEVRLVHFIVSRVEDHVGSVPVTGLVVFLSVNVRKLGDNKVESP
jgi:hypothetical protein